MVNNLIAITTTFYVRLISFQISQFCTLKIQCGPIESFRIGPIGWPISLSKWGLKRVMLWLFTCITAQNYTQKNTALIHSINLSKPKLVITGAEVVNNYVSIKNDIENPAVNHLTIPEINGTSTGEHKAFDMQASSASPAEPQLDYKIYGKDICMYVFTSGTTGLPKAAVISQARLVGGYVAFGMVLMQLTPGEKIYIPLPFYHATAMNVGWNAGIALGGAVILKQKFSVKDFWPDVAKYKATAFCYVGELCNYLLSAPVHPLEKNNTITKMVGNGLRSSIWMEFKKRFGIEKVGEFYGSSEGNLIFMNNYNFDKTMGATTHKHAIVKYDLEEEKPVLDENGFMVEVKKGEAGLLLAEITASQPFDGYTEKDKSESAILRDVLKKGDAYFNTNDLVRKMGFNHASFVDRLGDTFRWKSENVSTTEVEGVICGHEEVDECIVYGVQIPNMVGRAGMVNLILPADGSKKEFDLVSLYEYMKKELAGYSIPIFIRVSKSVATTETMKHQKGGLKKEGYDCEATGDPIYFLDPESKSYIPCTKEIRDKINAGAYQL